MSSLAQTVRSRLRPTKAPLRPALPPGGHDDLEAMEKADRAALIKRAAILGPIFTGVAHGEFYVVVMGLQRGRRLLLEHTEDLLSVTLEIESLVPKGLLRQMRGVDHLDYRRPLVRAAKGTDPTLESAMLERIARHHLSEYTAAGDMSPQALMATTSAIATSMLIGLFFGVEPGPNPGADLAQSLFDGFYELGPHGMAWNMGPRQDAAFALLRDLLRQALTERRNGTVPFDNRCVLAQVADEHEGDVDETMLGNLIFIAEMGRADVKNQIRWLTRYAAMNPDLLDRIASETVNKAVGQRSVAEAFAFEQLRSDQSERLTRIAERDIVFDGFLIPAGSYIRVCLWEAHQDSEAFPEPDTFKPDRFLGNMPSNDQYAPFGADHHQCPFGGATVRLASAYLRALATTYRPTLINDGPPVRGPYHWEPSRRLAVDIAIVSDLPLVDPSNSASPNPSSNQSNIPSTHPSSNPSGDPL